MVEIKYVEVKGDKIYINGVCMTEEELQGFLNHLMKSWNGVMCNLFEKVAVWFKGVQQSFFGIPKYKTEAVLQREAPWYYLRNKFRRINGNG